MSKKGAERERRKEGGVEAAGLGYGGHEREKVRGF